MMANAVGPRVGKAECLSEQGEKPSSYWRWAPTLHIPIRASSRY